MTKIHQLYENYCENKKLRDEFLNYLRKKDIDINARDENDQTVLMHAVIQDDLDMVIEILDRGADPLCIDKYGWNALRFALSDQTINEPLVQKLLASSPPEIYVLDVNQTDSTGSSVLHRAARIGNITKVASLLRLGGDINLADNDSKTPLRLIFESNYEQRLELLKLCFKSCTFVIQDFTGLEIPAGLTDNICVIGSTVDGQPVTRQTPGFKNAITNLAELNEAKEKGLNINYKPLYLALNRGPDENIKKYLLELIPDLKAFYDAEEQKKKEMFGKLIKGLKILVDAQQHQRVPPLRLKAADAIAKRWIFCEIDKTVPHDAELTQLKTTINRFPIELKYVVAHAIAERWMFYQTDKKVPHETELKTLSNKVDTLPDDVKKFIVEEKKRLNI